MSADKWVSRKICQIWEKKCLNFSESGAARALTKFNTSQPARVPKSSLHEFLKLLSGFGFEFTARSFPSFQLSTPDCSLISRGKRNSLFRKISCILVNWGMRERKVKKRVTMSRFQISCILVKWEALERKAGGNDVQVGASLIPFLVNTSLLILPDRRSNHKWDTALRNSSSCESHQRQQMADKRRAVQNWSESNS